MLTIKMKNDNDLNVRIVVECELHFGIKNLKYVEVCDGIYKERRVDQMRNRAFNHLQSLCDELKSIIRDKRYLVSYDAETKLYTERVMISDEFKDHFDNEMFETLSFTQTQNKVTDKDVEDLLSWHIRRLDDILDVLMI